jgi:hypothetical protein
MVCGLMAGVACGGKIAIGLGERCPVFRLDCLVHVLKGLRGYGRNHLLQRNFVFHGVSTAEAIKGTPEIPQLVGSKRPISPPLVAPVTVSWAAAGVGMDVASSRPWHHPVRRAAFVDQT